MLALKSLERVDVKESDFVPVEYWAWAPEVENPKELNNLFIEASGNKTTSKKTLSNQTDHGEFY